MSQMKFEPVDISTEPNLVLMAKSLSKNGSKHVRVMDSQDIRAIVSLDPVLYAHNLIFNNAKTPEVPDGYEWHVSVSKIVPEKIISEPVPVQLAEEIARLLLPDCRVVDQISRGISATHVWFRDAVT